MTTTLAALLRAVCEDPADDLLRLVLADWLDDHGQAERSEFVRLQMALAAWPCDCDTSEERVYHEECRCGEKFALQRRERELFKQYPAWVPRAVLDVPSAGLAFQLTPTPHREGYVGGVWRRGFISSITLPLADWLAHGPAVVACQPVEAVVLADREPDHEEDNLWRWYAGYEATDALPAEIARHMTPAIRTHGAFALGNEAAFHSRDDALSALSRAAVSWARGRAGLPPLPREES